MKIRDLIKQLEGLLEKGEDSVMVLYYDRMFWNSFTEEKLSKEEWARISFDVTCNFDCSRLQEDITSFIETE